MLLYLPHLGYRTHFSAYLKSWIPHLWFVTVPRPVKPRPHVPTLLWSRAYWDRGTHKHEREGSCCCPDVSYHNFIYKWPWTQCYYIVVIFSTKITLDFWSTFRNYLSKSVNIVDCNFPKSKQTPKHNNEIFFAFE